MPTTSSPPTSGATPVTSTYAVSPRNATSTAPANGLVGSPLANVVIRPVLGSIRETRPAAPSVTYSAPSGPTVLPWDPSRPSASRVALGPPGGWPPAAGGASAA